MDTSTLSKEDLLQIIEEQFMTYEEARNYLGISTRTMSDFTGNGKRKRLTSVKEGVKLYLRADVEKVDEETEKKRKKYGRGPQRSDSK